MKIIIIFFIVLFLFFRFISKYDNPYKLICIFGKKGVGKSTYLTKIAYKYRKQGYKVFANIHIPDTNYYSVGDIGQKMFPENSVVIIDEIGIYFNNRMWANTSQDLIRYMKLQRHYRNIVICSSQALDMEKCFRDMFDEVYLLRKIFNIFTIVKPIYKTVGISNDSNEGGKLIDAYSWGFGIHDIVYIPHWIEFFDSFDIVKLPEIKEKYEDISDVQKQLQTFAGYLKIKYSRIIKRCFMYCVSLFKTLKDRLPF